MLKRMTGAAFFNAHTYEEIEANPGTMPQAVAVVLLVTFCTIIGGLAQDMFGDITARKVLLELAVGLTFGIVRWALWVTIVLLVGGGLLRTHHTETSWTEMGRILGFALTPGLLALFASAPFAGWVFFWAAIFWSVAAAVLGVRQGMDYESTGRAMLVVAISGLIAVIPLGFTWYLEFSLSSRF